MNMTIQELRNYVNNFADKNGIETPIPSPQKIDKETYANLVSWIIRMKLEKGHAEFAVADIGYIELTIGENGGVIYKAIEWLCE